MRRSQFIRGLALATAGLTSGAGFAADVFLGGPGGQIVKGDSQQGNFEFFGTCGGTIDSMIVFENTLYIGTTQGDIYSFDLQTLQPGMFYSVSNDATALASHGQELLVSGSDGSIIRLDPTTGQEVGFYQTQIPQGIGSMTVRGDYAYIGGSEGSVWRVDLLSGANSYFACVCFTDVQALVTDATHLILAEAAGIVSRIRLTNGQIEQAFGVTPFPRAMQIYDDELLISDNSGQVIRVNAFTGQMVADFNAPIEVFAMGGLPEPQCASDISGNGLVNLVDLSILLSNFGTFGGSRHEDGDIDGDGNVGLGDLSALLTDFGTSCD